MLLRKSLNNRLFEEECNNCTTVSFKLRAYVVHMGVHVDKDLVKNRKHVVNFLTLDQHCSFPQIQNWMQVTLFSLRN